MEEVRNRVEHATTLKAVSRFLHILETDNATLKETHKGTGRARECDIVTET